MTILFAGGEDVDFTMSGLFSYFTSAGAGKNRAVWSRYGLATKTAGVSDPPQAGATTPLFTATTDFWTHAQWYWSGLNPSNTTGSQIIRWLDAGGVGRLAIRNLNSATGQLKLSKRDAAGTFTDLVTSAGGIFPLGVSQLDVHINYAVAGSVNVYVNSVLVMTYSGDVTTNSATQLAQVQLASADCGGNGADTYWSEVIVATNDTRAMNLWTMNGTTAGNAQAWTGTASNPNQTTNNDATFISSATANQIQEYKTPTLAQPPGTYTVEAVVNSVRASNGTTGPQNLNVVTRIATTDYLSSNQLLTNSFANYANFVQSTNPATAAAWTTTDLLSTNYQYGVKSIT